MIIVYGGSQPDAPDREVPRLPTDAEAGTKRRLRGLFQDLRPRLVVGALAAGADILLAEAAQEEGVSVRAVLPYGIDDFRATSVVGHGSSWTERYDRLIKEVEVHCLDQAVREETYREHNGVMLDVGARLAEENGERLWCLLVRPRVEPERPSSVTDDLAARAEGRGVLTLDLDPIAHRSRTFVVMPYGTKFDPGLRRSIDCDAAFHRIYRPLLEDLDLDWNRADLAADSGLIHAGMIDDLANSDIVLADLTASNFNVAYELGMRHVFARRSTVLISPHVVGYLQQSPPFDVGLNRVHWFERSIELSDAEAERAITTLRPVLAAALSEAPPDSPVHEWFEVDSIERPFCRRSAAVPVDETLRLRDMVRLALKSSDSDEMKTAAEKVSSAAVDEPIRSLLRIELAVGLIGEAEYPEALELLEAALPSPDSPLHRLWLHQTAMTLRRLAEDPACSLGESDSLLQRAEGLLEIALDAGYHDSETYGIRAGLLKRRIANGSLSALEQAAAFEVMTDMYGVGFRADPQAYTGLNYAMALRLQQRKHPLTDRQVHDLREALVVAEFLNERDLASEPSAQWSLMTRAELYLHVALLEGTDLGATGVAYAKAALLSSSNVKRSAREQLQFLIQGGDDAATLSPIIDVLEEAKK